MTAPSDGTPHLSARDAVAHLTPDLWARANRLLIRKGLAEFAHERLLAPGASRRTATTRYAATTTPPSTASPPADEPWTTGRSTPTASPGTAMTPNSPGCAGLLPRTP